MNILNNSFSGRWVLNPRRYVDKLHSLIDSLFGNGEQGAMYIPKPRVLGQQVLWQDVEGTVPVMSDGDPVGLMLDLSGNDNHAAQETSSQRPIYRTDGVLHWLQVNGTETMAMAPFESRGFVGVSWVTATIGTGTRAILSGGQGGYLRNLGTVTNLQGGDNSEGISTKNPQSVGVWADGAVAKILDHTGDSATLTVGMSGLSTANRLFAFSATMEVPWEGEFAGAILSSSTPSEAARSDAIKYLADLAGVTP